MGVMLGACWLKPSMCSIISDVLQHCDRDAGPMVGSATWQYCGLYVGQLATTGNHSQLLPIGMSRGRGGSRARLG